VRDAFPFPGGFGIAYVHVACAPGTGMDSFLLLLTRYSNTVLLSAAAIAGFYREIVRASVTVVAAGTGMQAHRRCSCCCCGLRMPRHCLGAVAIVGMGPGQELVFVETAAGTVPKYDGHHLAIYIADFSGVFRRLEVIPRSKLSCWQHARASPLDVSHHGCVV
jgi:hypothetical protein